MMSSFVAAKRIVRLAGLMWAFAIAAALAIPFSQAHAQSVKIVALGASNTQGKGVSPSQAYPAHLQSMLKARGVSASVINAGINGDTTGGMLSRLDRAVPSGTQVVILQPGGNDKRRGQQGDRAGNISQIRSRLAARNIKVILLENHLLHAVPPGERQPDGSHLTPAGYARLAASILPQVLAAIGK